MARSSLTRRDMMSLAALGLGGWAVSQLLQGTAPLGRDVSSNGTARALMGDADAPTEGPDDADLTVVIFADYQCPACRRASPALDAAYTADSHVRLIYKEWPIFGAASEQAARVALAANRQGIYPKVHRALMRAPAGLEENSLRRIIEQAGGDWPLLTGDLRMHQATLDLMLAKTSAQAFALGLGGTPAFLIGSLLVVGALDEAEFHEAFASARAGKPVTN